MNGYKLHKPGSLPSYGSKTACQQNTKKKENLEIHFLGHIHKQPNDFFCDLYMYKSCDIKIYT